MYKYALYLFAAGIVSLSSCSKEIFTPTINQVAGVEVVFLDAESAFTYQRANSSYVAEQLQQIDVSIILEQDLADRSLEEVRELYLENLAANTLDWKVAEVANFEGLLEGLFQRIAERTPAVLPDTLYLIKTTGDETIGKGAMYTSAKSLTIPRMNTRTAGWGFLEDEVKETLAHELFHIYSNRNKPLRSALYEVIGFYPVALDLGAARDQIIANPDADYNWAIELERNGQTLEAVLLTYSPYPRWEGSKSSFGLKPGKGYLDYGLFAVEPDESGTYRLTTGLTELAMEEVEGSLRERIGDHTDYIWAVEEIIADTYPYLLWESELQGERERAIRSRLRALLQ
jgi:hypothetical protein